jgi:hypothetical protein
MITYANLFLVTALGDGTVRLEFKTQNPHLAEDKPNVAIIYMTKENTADLAGVIGTVLDAKPIPAGKPN